MVRHDGDGGAPGSGDPGPLTGVTVIDLTHVLAGPYATMLLADLGACVLKVEPPVHGDTSRHTPPFRDGVSHFFAAVNRNKSSIAIDLKHPEGAEMLRTLAESADVLVHNFRPAVMEKLGLGYEALQRRNHKLIYCEITGFGTSGPLSERPAF